MQQDPDSFAAGDSILYRYVNNQPTNVSDPSGLALVASDRGVAEEYIRFLNSVGVNKVQIQNNINGRVVFTDPNVAEVLQAMNRSDVSVFHKKALFALISSQKDYFLNTTATNGWSISDTKLNASELTIWAEEQAVEFLQYEAAIDAHYQVLWPPNAPQQQAPSGNAASSLADLPSALLQQQLGNGFRFGNDGPLETPPWYQALVGSGGDMRVSAANTLVDGRGLMIAKGGQHHDHGQTTRSAEGTGLAPTDARVAGEWVERTGFL
jgi:hypothetical protein